MFIRMDAELPDRVQPVADAEVAAVLAAAIRDGKGGTMSREAEMFLAGVCAEFLVERLALAGLRVVRPGDPRVTSASRWTVRRWFRRQHYRHWNVLQSGVMGLRLRRIRDPSRGMLDEATAA